MIKYISTNSVLDFIKMLMTAFIEYEINAIRVPREVPQYHLTSDNKPIIVYTIPFAIAALGLQSLWCVDGDLKLTRLNLKFHKDNN